MPILEVLLTKKDVAKLLKLDERSVDRMRRAGLIPEPILVGTGRKRRVRFAASLIDAWLRAACPDAATFKKMHEEAARGGVQ